MEYLHRLPEELAEKEFRVIAPPDGYQDSIESILFDGETDLELVVQHEFSRMVIRTFVDRDEIGLRSPTLFFDRTYGQILTENREETGNLVVLIHLSIDLSVLTRGATAGTARLSYPSHLPPA